MNEIKEKINSYDEIHTFQTQVDVLNRMSERQTNINTSYDVRNKSFINDENINGMYQQTNYYNQQYVPQENDQLLIQQQFA